MQDQIEPVEDEGKGGFFSAIGDFFMSIIKAISSFFSDFFKGLTGSGRDNAPSSAPVTTAPASPPSRAAGRTTSAPSAGEGESETQAAAEPKASEKKADPKLTKELKEAQDRLVKNCVDSAHQYTPEDHHAFVNLEHDIASAKATIGQKTDGYNQLLKETVGKSGQIDPKEAALAQQVGLFPGMREEIKEWDNYHHSLARHHSLNIGEAQLARTAVNPLNDIGKDEIFKQNEKHGHMDVILPQNAQVDIVAPKSGQQGWVRLVVKPKNTASLHSETDRADFAAADVDVPIRMLEQGRVVFNTHEYGQNKIDAQADLLPEGTTLVVQAKGKAPKVIDVDHMVNGQEGESVTQESMAARRHELAEQRRRTEKPPLSEAELIKRRTEIAELRAKEEEAKAREARAKQDARTARRGGWHQSGYNRATQTFNPGGGRPYGGFTPGRVGPIVRVESGHGLPYNTNNPGRGH